MAKRRGYHLLYSLALLSLLALAVWWSVFIERAITNQREFHVQLFEIRTTIIARSLGQDENPPQLGGRPDFPQFEIISTHDSVPGDFSVAAAPRWKDFAVRPLRSEVRATEKKYQRQMVMLVGEGTLLLLTIFICTWMLYRLIAQERRLAGQMEDFLSTVTHELKTPIVGVKSLLQTLSQDRVSKEQIPQLLILALTNMDRLEHLVENVLISGRLRIQGYPLQPSPLELRPFLVRFVEHRCELLHSRPEALVLEGEDVPLWVLAESDALRVILENLVDNALKYGGEERITVRVKQEGNEVGITVADRGIGFHPGEAEPLFTPFFRALSGKQSVKHGTGLGLHISRSLARQMGGDLKAFSKGLGEGSCFTLFLRAA